jgi:hypothetical protein
MKACALTLLFVLVCAARAEEPVRQRCVVGAIRWDAWHGERGGPGKAVEKSLGPKHWHSRLPFYAKEVSDSQVEVRADSQEVMDKEIAYARAAGLDYWAFVAYAEQDAMSLGLKLYLSSARKKDINFCVILGASGFPKTPAEIARYAGYFKDPSYQRVAGARPLVYLLWADKLKERCGSWEAAKAAVDALRAAATAAGAGRLYIAIQNSANDKQAMEQLGADAISAYALWGGTKDGRPYAELARKARDFWDQQKRTGAKVIPLATAGWDRRPRVENPVPWEPGPGSAAHHITPTPAELAAHVKDAVEWNARNADAAEANAVLIYAWNENDEGGWLVPTMTEGAARVEALGAALRRAAEAQH